MLKIIPRCQTVDCNHGCRENGYTTDYAGLQFHMDTIVLIKLDKNPSSTSALVNNY